MRSPPKPISKVYVVVMSSGKFMEDYSETLLRAFQNKEDAERFAKSKSIEVATKHGMLVAVNKMMENIILNNNSQELCDMVGLTQEDLKVIPKHDENFYFTVKEAPFGF